MWNDFKAFMMRGNALDLAVGIIIGAAFSAIVNSLVNDIIMPPIGLLLGNVDFSNLFVLLKNGNPAAPYTTPAEANAAGAVTINYGVFINAIISFIIVAIAVFVLIRIIGRLYGEEEAPPAEPTTKDCPFCFSTIPIQATRCPECTSEILAA